MPHVAKRKLTETWRQAVARRAAECDREAECLADYDRAVRAGRREVEAAYAALSLHDCLSRIPDGPTRPTADVV